MFNIVNRKIGHHQRSIIISAEVQITRGVWHRLDQSTHGGRRNGNISLVLVVVMHRPTVHHGYSFIFKYSQEISRYQSQDTRRRWNISRATSCLALQINTVGLPSPREGGLK